MSTGIHNVSRLINMIINHEQILSCISFDIVAKTRHLIDIVFYIRVGSEMDTWYPQ